MICGTCSLCGGAVTMPDDWACILPPVKSCSSCGAVAAEHGPVIQMQRPMRTVVVNGVGTGAPASHALQIGTGVAPLILNNTTS